MSFPTYYHPILTGKLHRKHISKTKHQNTNCIKKVFEQENLDDFLSHTTIPGVFQWINHKSFGWKIVWMIVIFIGLTMAIYQSTSALGGYSQDAVVQTIAFKYKPEIIFPALTFCTNIMVDINPNNPHVDPDLKKLIEQLENEMIVKKNLTFYEIHRLIQKYRTEIMIRMMNWNDEKRIAKTHGNYKFFSHCNWKFNNCDFTDKDLFRQSNNLQFGKCMTFNPGLNRSRLESAAAGRTLSVILDMNSASRLKLINLNFAVLIIHPTEQPPILKTENLNYLYPGKFLQLFLTGKQVNLLKVKNIKKCIEDVKSVKPVEFFHTEDMPYKYSKDACAVSCHYRKNIDKKVNPCLKPDMPLQTLLKMKEQYKNISICPTETDLTEEPETNNKCGCQDTCKEPGLTATAMSVSLWKLIHNGDKYGPVIKYFNEISLNSSVIEVSYATTEYMHVTEAPKYSSTDFFGLIGGNLSLWVGINVLCIIELFELLIIVLQKHFNKRPKRNRSSSLFKYRTLM